MRYKFDRGSVVFEIDPNSNLDKQYIDKHSPTAITPTTFRFPATPTSLKKFRQWWSIHDQQLDNWIFSLEIDVELSLLDKVLESKTEMLRPYQEQGASWIRNSFRTKNFCGLFWPPRTGKTRTSLIACSVAKKIIVLSLSGQEDNWTSTAYEYCGFDMDTEIFSPKQMDYNTKDKRLMFMYPEFNKAERAILVISLHTLCNDMLKHNAWLKDFDVLIIDEIHKLKNSKTNLHKGVAKVIAKAQKVLGLTGTPASKHAADVLPLIGLMSKKQFSKTYLVDYFFHKEYHPVFDYQKITQLKTSKQTEWLEFLAIYFSQIPKEIALPWAEKPNIYKIHLKMTKEQEQIYERIMTNLEYETQDNEVYQIDATIAMLTRLQQVNTSPQLLNIKAHSIKDTWIKDYLKEKPKKESVIIFSTHTSYLKLLYKDLNILNYKVGLITGETTNKTQVANDFQKGTYDIILCNIQAGSKGITLDRADTMIFVDLDWRPDENEQALERFTPTTPERLKIRNAYYLMNTNEIKVEHYTFQNIDEYIWDVTQKKLSQTEVVNKFKEFLQNKN